MKVGQLVHGGYLDSTVIMNTLVFNMVCEWLSDNALFWKSVNDSLYDFDWVFPEIPVKSCIVGMLLACPICGKNEQNAKLPMFLKPYLNHAEKIITAYTKALV